MSPDSITPVTPPTGPDQVAEAPPIPLPSLQDRHDTPSQPADPDARPGVLDAILFVLIAALAFLLAAMPARNSDLWLHLASGRAFVQGQSSFGVDPFGSTTKGVYWVNHAWLTDVILYELYELGGGRSLVLAKCILVAMLAMLFFSFRRANTRGGIVSFAAAVAVLALGPWLVLQSTLLSLLGVVLTLYLLERPGLVESSRTERAASMQWWLVPVFALWANVDAWFVLGPLLVGLYATGAACRRLVGGPGSIRTGEVRRLGLLTMAGLAACLLTPYHYHIFEWPSPLGFSHAEQVFMTDPLGQGLVVSPFGAKLAISPAFASPGGWAYCLLLAAGALSFVLRGRAMHVGRLFVWLVFAGLSVYQARTIPFFAVAAAPIVALNLQEAYRAKAFSGSVRRLEAFARGAGVVAALALLVVAWPGWLQPSPYRPRAWTLAPDASLVRLAHVLNEWHAEGRFREDRFALTFSPEAANQLAWHCPSEKGFFDSRLPLFDRAADDFVRMRRCLLETGDSARTGELGALLDAYNIDRIILYDPDFDRTTRAYQRLLAAGNEWKELAVEGTAVLFGRHSRDEAGTSWQAIDRKRAAYGAESDGEASIAVPPAPQPPGHFDAFWRFPDDRSPDRAEAALHVIYFDQKSGRMRADLASQWLAAHAVGLAGAGSQSGGTPGAVAIRLELTPLLQAPPTGTQAQTGSAVGQQAAETYVAKFLAAHDRGPAEALLLAIRAARRALSGNPDDAGVFLLLGEAYLRMRTLTREGNWQTALPTLASIRRAQTLAALEQATRLRPDLDQAHDLLAQYYYEAGQMDRALDHLRARLRIAKEEARKNGSNASVDERRIALESGVEQMESIVQRSLKIYDANAVGMTDPSQVLDRARLACRYGLTRKALEMLLESHPAIFGKAGTELQLELMLQAGRAFEVRAWLEPEQETMLGFWSYHSFQAQAAAACGEYTAADAELDKLGEQIRVIQTSPEKVMPVRTVIALRVGGAVLTRPMPGAGPAGLAAMAFQQFDELRPLGGPATLLGQEADLLGLRGLLAVESGQLKTSRKYFRAALDVWGSEDHAARGEGIDFVTRPFAQHELRLLEEKGGE